MLEKLIESTDNRTQRRKMRKYLFGVGTLVSALLVCGMIVSIFSTNLAMGTGDFELSTLISPAPIPEKNPPAPETGDTSKKSESDLVSKLPVRVKIIQRTSETPADVPKKVSVAPNKFKARPQSAFVLSPDGDRDGTNGRKIRPGSNVDDGRIAFGNGNASEVTDTGKSQSLPKKAAPPPSLKPAIVKTGGVMNGKAKRLVKPVMTASAKAVGARGIVEVNVLISEQGRVLSANAVGGHALLRPLAVNAALRSTFTPTYLSSVPVKVQGLIIYNFK